jgi:hypothetical protein
MKRVFAVILVLLSSGAVAQNYLSDDGTFKPVYLSVAVTMLNGGAVNALPGEAVKISAAGTVQLAQADSLAHGAVVGVAGALIAPASSGSITAVGLVTLTTVQWNAVTGGSGGLTSGSLYFLDPSYPGHLTVTAPSVAGQVIVSIGRALSTTQMMVIPGLPVLL